MFEYEIKFFITPFLEIIILLLLNFSLIFTDNIFWLVYFLFSISIYNILPVYLLFFILIDKRLCCWLPLTVKIEFKIEIVLNCVIFLSYIIFCVHFQSERIIWFKMSLYTRASVMSVWMLLNFSYRALGNYLLYIRSKQQNYPVVWRC